MGERRLKTMTRIEELRRRLELKWQLIVLINEEIKELRDKLKEVEK